MNGLRVLLIEDEEIVSKFLSNSLMSDGFNVKVAANGNDGKIFAIDFRPEIVILDLGLPDMNGIDVLVELRKWLEIPIIILTANQSDEDKVKALELGADDYLTKPFSYNELKARFKAIFRRTNKIDSNKIRSAHINIDLQFHQAFFNDIELKLTQTEFEILKYLIKDAGKVVVHRMLLKNIWGPNSIEHTQYLRVYVGQLRKKLIQVGASQDIILTETGIGYRLNDL